MTRRRVLLLLFLPGCAYYNGMYNANRYAKQAEHSEQAGRRGEAADRWRLAAIHAESVVTRHPRSRWADDAQLVRGRALVHLGSYSDAALVLELAARAAPAGEQRCEAWLYLGQANLALRRYPRALEALDSAAESRDARRRGEALLYRGRARMATNRPQEALADFRASNARAARVDRVHAALVVGDTALMAAFADSLLALPFLETWWLPLLGDLGRAGLVDQAGRLVDVLLERRDVDPGARARLLLADGDRQLEAGRDSTAVRRFQGVLSAVPDSGEARAAAVRLVRLDLRAAPALDDASGVREQLERMAELGGAPGQEAEELVRLLRRADSLAAATTSGDAFWFLRAELLRDSLGAPVLAASAFAEMAQRFPASPWTPKGLLAAIAGGYAPADSLRALLRERYPTNPYSLLALGTGDDPERFAVLEDSLRQVLAADSGAGAPTRAPALDEPDSSGRPVGPGTTARPPATPRPAPATPRRTVDP